MPLVVLLALVFTLGRASSDGAGNSSSSATAVLGPVDVDGSDPPASARAACTAIVAAVPVRLNGLAPRVVHGPQFAVAWGDPAVVLRCGSSRPADLKPGSAAFVQLIKAPNNAVAAWLPSEDKTFTRWTLIDRSVYVEVTVPSTVPGSPVITAVTAALAKLPVVCETQDPTARKLVPRNQLCVYRK